MIAPEPEMTYTVRTTHPLTPKSGSPSVARQYWQVSEASLLGDRIRAELWLNTSLFVAAGRLLGTGHIEYAIYRAT